MDFKILCTFLLVGVILSEAAVLRRKKRSLGLVKLGVDTASRISSGVFNTGALTANKVAAGIVFVKPLALMLLGKYTLYKWLLGGFNPRGVEGDELKLTGVTSAHLGDDYDEYIGTDYWYESSEDLTKDSTESKPLPSSNDIVDVNLYRDDVVDVDVGRYVTNPAVSKHVH